MLFHYYADTCNYKIKLYWLLILIPIVVAVIAVVYRNVDTKPDSTMTNISIAEEGENMTANTVISVTEGNGN